MTDDPALSIAVPLISAFEGFRSKPYQDAGGVWTYAYGVTIDQHGARVTAATPPICEGAALEQLRVLVARVLQRVRTMVEVDISPKQAAALASLAYNEGTGRVGRSTLIRLLNCGEYANAAVQFGAFVYDDGRVSDGLRNRREAEKRLFLEDIQVISEADALNDAELNLLKTEGS